MTAAHSFDDAKDEPPFSNGTEWEMWSANWCHRPCQNEYYVKYFSEETRRHWAVVDYENEYLRIDGPSQFRPSREEIRRELAGKDLACWCPVGQSCHADVLLRIANEDPS